MHQYSYSPKDIPIPEPLTRGTISSDVVTVCPILCHSPLNYTVKSYQTKVIIPLGKLLKYTKTITQNTCGPWSDKFWNVLIFVVIYSLERKKLFAILGKKNKHKKVILLNRKTSNSDTTTSFLFRVIIDPLVQISASKFPSERLRLMM